MSQTELTALDLVSTGVNLWRLRNPNLFDPAQYANFARTLLELLDKAHFLNSSNLAGPLYRDIEQLASEFVNVPEKYRAKEASYITTANSINKILEGECKNRTLILTDAKTPASLDKLTGLHAHQEALRDDLVICLKAHLARPAIVMAWALGYDLVRSWVYSDPQRLPAFNTQLAKARRSGEPTSIVDYHDFFRIGEYRFLEVCRDSQDANFQRFTDRTFRDLQNLLDQRNDFAHANYTTASPAEATAYVERMVRLITTPPFDK